MISSILSFLFQAPRIHSWLFFCLWLITFIFIGTIAIIYIVYIVTHWKTFDLKNKIKAILYSLFLG